MLDSIPPDIVLDIIQYLDHPTITALERTCRYLRYVVETHGWMVFLRQTPHYTPSLSTGIESKRWTARDLVRHLMFAQEAWHERKFVARPLGPEWNTSFHPVLALHNNRLIVGAGNSLISYSFKRPAPSSETTRISFERAIAFPKDARKDITGIGYHNNGDDLIISFVHGGLGRISLRNTLCAPASSRKRTLVTKVPKLALVKDVSTSRIKDLSISGDSALTVDSSGTLTLFSLQHARPEIMCTRNPFENPGTGPGGGGGGGGPGRYNRTVAWSNYLSLTSSTGFAVVGISSFTNALSVFNISESTISHQPFAHLSSSMPEDNSVRSTAVYALAGNNSNSSTNNIYNHPYFSDQVVVSGWYHGRITMHDLRCSTSPSKILSPTLVLQDPLAFSSIYSISMADYRIAAGSGHYSLLQLYDVRAPRSGFSIYLPQGRQSSSSPVYSTIMESTRVWAGTESHALVVDFGKTSNSTFPVVPERYGSGKSKTKAPVYEHSDYLLQYR